MCRSLDPKIQDCPNMVRRKLAVIFFRELRQVCWRHLQFTRGWAVPFAHRTVASGTVTRVHGLTRTRIRLLHRSFLDHLVLRDGQIRAAGRQKSACDEQAPKEREL